MRMRHGLLVLLAVVVIPAPADAHRLDEYLQATRVRLEPRQIILEVDLTAGSSIASDVMALIDRDGNRVISPAEAAAFGRVVAAEMLIEVDGRASALTLSRVEVPSPGEIAEGVGAIQITAHTDAPLDLGRHRVVLTNLNRPQGSVYLANVLVPQTPAIRILGQWRDASQQTFTLEYELSAVESSQLMWLVGAGASLTSLVVSRKGILRISRSAQEALCVIVLSSQRSVRRW
jgi:hypothetical protein